MNKAWQIFKQHPISILFYAVYFFFCYITLSAMIEYDHATKLQHLTGGNRLAWGEGVAYGRIFTLMIGTIFLMITLINLAIKDHQLKFYTWLCVAIIAPVIVIFSLF